MGDYSRSQFWDELEEAPEENWKQEYMESAIRRYLSRPDSPHPPSSPTPDDDPIHHSRLMKLSRYCKLEDDRKTFIRDTSRTIEVINKDFTESNDEDDEEKLGKENNLVKKESKL
jgi:hypothetical protein